MSNIKKHCFAYTRGSEEFRAIAWWKSYLSLDANADNRAEIEKQFSKLEVAVALQIEEKAQVDKIFSYYKTLTWIELAHKSPGDIKKTLKELETKDVKKD